MLLCLPENKFVIDGIVLKRGGMKYLDLEIECTCACAYTYISIGNCLLLYQIIDPFYFRQKSFLVLSGNARD